MRQVPLLRPNTRRLMPSTKRYWQELSQLDAAPQAIPGRDNEFNTPLPIDEMLADKGLAASSTGRRDFLKFLGFSLSAATLAACETPVIKSIPYLNKPEDITPGIANWYASTYYDGADYASVLVKTREGRPIHVKGNTRFGINHRPESGKGSVNARINSSVLRAFAAHFAERHRAYKARQDELGFGRLPLSFADALDCGPDEAHVLFVDQIARGDILGYQLPVPGTFSSAAKISVTLAYASPVEPTQPTEYTSASLELTLRPHRNIFRFSPPRGSTEKPRNVDLTSTEARTLLTSGWTSSQEPVTKTLTSAASLNEADLRDSGKWETLRHHRVSFAAGEINDARLELRYFARRAGALDGSPTEVPFAILVSVSDPNTGGTLYDEIAAQFAALRPVQRVAGRVRLRSSRQNAWH